MGKIKGWKKHDEDGNYVSWESEYDGNLIEVKQNKVVYGLTNWKRPNQTGEPVFTKKFKTNKEAVVFARTFMKKNPKGY